MSASYLTAESLAEIYRIPLKTVWKFIRRGEFKGAIKIGRAYRVPHEAKAEFEKRHIVNAKTTQ